jgi:hypothetical protein
VSLPPSKSPESLQAALTSLADHRGHDHTVANRPRRTGARGLAARARRVARIRRGVAAGTLSAFVLAWGAIASTGSMGETSAASSTASAASTSSSAATDDGSVESATTTDDTTTSSDSAAAVVTRQS